MKISKLFAATIFGISLIFASVNDVKAATDWASICADTQTAKEHVSECNHWRLQQADKQAEEEKKLADQKKQYSNMQSDLNNAIPYWSQKDRTGQNAEDNPISYEDAKDGSVTVTTGSGETVTADTTGVNFIGGKAMTFISVLSMIIFGFAFIMIVFAGFKYVGSEGDTKVMEQAKKQIIVAGIGIGLSVFNLLIIKFFESIIGV